MKILANEYKDKKYVGDVNFVSDPLLCLTRDRSADHPAVWFCEECANQWQRKTFQLRGFYAAGRAGDMCGGVFLLLKVASKLGVLIIKSSGQWVSQRHILTAEGFLQPAEFHGSPVRREPDVVQVSCREEILK